MSPFLKMWKKLTINAVLWSVPTDPRHSIVDDPARSRDEVIVMSIMSRSRPESQFFLYFQGDLVVLRTTSSVSLHFRVCQTCLEWWNLVRNFSCLLTT